MKSTKKWQAFCIEMYGYISLNLERTIFVIFAFLSLLTFVAGLLGLATQESVKALYVIIMRLGFSFIVLIWLVKRGKRKKNVTVADSLIIESIYTADELNLVAEKGDSAFKANLPTSINPYLIPNTDQDNFELAMYWRRGYDAAEKRKRRRI